PLIEGIMIGSVADNGELRAGKLLEACLDLSSLRSPVAGAHPGVAGFKARPDILFKVERDGTNANAGHDYAERDAQAGEDEAYRLAFGLPEAQMTHGLQAQRIKDDCEGRQVVKEHENFNCLTSHEHQEAKEKEADAVIAQDAA